MLRLNQSEAVHCCLNMSGSKHRTILSFTYSEANESRNGVGKIAAGVFH
jgi:hypothetical protein